MKGLRLFVLLKKVVASSTCLDCRSPKISNYSTLASTNHQTWSFFSEEREGESSVYKHALMFKRPSTIDYQKGLQNSVSLIGTVELPLKKVNCSTGSLGVHTMLRIKNSHSGHYSKVLLIMWHEMAEVSINCVKPNDFIYVWGHLASYEKTGKDGIRRMLHQVNVKEINYVAQKAEAPLHQQTNQLFHGEDAFERVKNRLHLWQVFFANPYEWNDFRKTKKNPKHPDFKHKNTGEVLWLHHDDPPWISRQLQLLDSVILGQSGEGYMSSKLCSFLPEKDTMEKI